MAQNAECRSNDLVGGMLGIRYIEPLRDLAAEAYELSGRQCGACRNSHGLWPYTRLSRASTGAEREGSPLILAEFLTVERPTVLTLGGSFALDLIFVPK
ncbi:MAG: hypothetical protein WB689_15190, partial [Xanthobacteraceae bacterium]